MSEEIKIETTYKLSYCCQLTKEESELSERHWSFYLGSFLKDDQALDILTQMQGIISGEAIKKQESEETK